MRKGRRGENGLSNQWIRLYPRIYNPLPERNEFPVFSCSPFLRRCFRSCLFRGIPASNIGWNWMEWQRGQRVSVWQRFKGASHAFVDAKQDPATPLPLALLFDIQLNREASVFTRG